MDIIPAIFSCPKDVYELFNVLYNNIQTRVSKVPWLWSSEYHRLLIYEYEAYIDSLDFTSKRLTQKGKNKEDRDQIRTVNCQNLLS